MSCFLNKREFLRRFLIFVLGLQALSVSAQIYGPELVVNGNFGSISTQGKNGDNSTGTHIYPGVSVSNIGTYYQPASSIYNESGNLLSLTLNTTATVGKPLASDQTSYTWGLSTNGPTKYYFPKRNNGGKSTYQVPHGPSDGYYIIATTTRGMYGPPSYSYMDWPKTVYDKYETNTNSPSNYFMIVNADYDKTKLFYLQKISVQPGQAYRMSVDLVRLNMTGQITPNVAFIIDPDKSLLTTVAAKSSTTLPTPGEWVNTFFDYVAPCSATSVYVAFRNNESGGGGNDLGLDNLSMKAIIPQIQANITSSGTGCAAVFTLTGSIVDAFKTGYTFQWQKKTGNTFVNISGKVDRTFSTNDAGVYRLAIYTTATSGCPMYSNEIVLVKHDGCVDVPKPTAVDDYYVVKSEQELHANILTNDLPSELNGAITVTSFTINGTTYASGTNAQVYKNGSLAGVVSIDQSGNITFKSVPGLSLPQVMPDITYNISESGAGYAQAVVHITVVAEPTVLIDASCTKCPIKITMSGSSLLPGPAYSVYRNNVKKGTFDASYQAVFTEDVSGELTYVIKDNFGTEMKTVVASVHPSVAVWKSAVTDDVWANANNWQSSTGGGYPIWCTDVTLPSGANRYPTLKSGDACRDITFKNGTAVGQIQYLLYRKAYIELLLDRNRWYMLGAPLRYMYSADYHGDMTWTDSMSPKIFMMYFNVKSNVNPDGRVGYRISSFSAPFANLEERVGPEKGFALWVNGKDEQYSYPDQNFLTGTPYKFPRRLPDGNDVTYSYHDAKTGEWLYPSGALSRGAVASIPDSLTWVSNHNSLTQAQKDNRYRFVFEDNYVNGQITVAINAAATNIIGNPFMSYLNFDKFYSDNKTKIYGYYRIWDGVKFYSYISDGGTESWSGLTGLSTDISPSATSRYIAPMQSFFVESKPGAESLLFKPENVTSGGVSTAAVLRSSSQDLSNIIRLNLKLSNDESQVIVALRSGASGSFKKGEDIEKLFAPGDQLAELYTLTTDLSPSEINLIGVDAESQDVEIGIKTIKTGLGTLSFSGMDKVDSYSNIKLIDKVLNKEYDLRKVESVSFEKSSTENLEKRFYLRVSGKPTSGIGEDIISSESSISLKKDGDKYRVESTGDLIQNVSVYDILGRLIKEKARVESLDVEVGGQTLGKGVYLIKVRTATAESTFKIAI